jgi:hypothetical protein
LYIRHHPPRQCPAHRETSFHDCKQYFRTMLSLYIVIIIVTLIA